MFKDSFLLIKNQMYKKIAEAGIQIATPNLEYKLSK